MAARRRRLDVRRRSPSQAARSDVPAPPRPLGETALTVAAYAAASATEPLAPTTIERRDVGPYDVLIEIKYCGICHSDIHHARGDRGPQTYPVVLGHELAGIVTRLAPRYVVDVPSTLSARARLLATGGDRKTDPADALHVAQVALFRTDLRKVTAEDQSTILRLLTERHDDLTGERTRIVNRLHAVLRDLLPGGAPTRLSAEKAATLMKGIRQATATNHCRRDIARDLLADLRRLDRQVKDNEAQMRDALAAARTSLTSLPGLGTVLAAKLLGHVGDISRFPTEHHFASYVGRAPLDASSGKRVRHRLNTGGNRALNSALHIIAVCQIRNDGRGREYYLRKIAEGKTPAEARRALKRRLSNVVYRIMKRDQRVQLAVAA
ncbi:IS110 family RNA-guided transposase [Streptomyces mirabilis]|uniref:IS110 family transposase n=1 Tax=Streptomyces mirabilis TaxID=68239 RepID=UPI00332B9D1B